MRRDELIGKKCFEALCDKAQTLHLTCNIKRYVAHSQRSLGGAAGVWSARKGAHWPSIHFATPDRFISRLSMVSSIFRLFSNMILAGSQMFVELARLLLSIAIFR